jgi:hypothetical protein
MGWSTGPSLPTRRWLYPRVLATVLGGAFVWAPLSVLLRADPAAGPPAELYRPPRLDPVVLGTVVAAVVALLWLRPRPLPYAAGLLCLVAAFAGPWLVGSGLVRHWSQSGTPVGYLTLFFPVAWVALGRSAGYRRSGVAYLVAGAAFTLTWLCVGWGAGIAAHGLALPSPPPLWLLVALSALWPHFLLAALGVFTWSLPIGS